MTTHFPRRLGPVAVAAVLALSVAACGQEKEASTDQPTTGTVGSPEAATAAAEWIRGELKDGVLFNEQYDVADYSTTVEAAYALLAIEGDGADLDDVSAALAEGVDAYASPDKDVYAGSTAKLVAFAADTGADATDFGGVDLVAQLEERTAENGRISDVSQYGDYANSLGQAWAVRGLTEVASGEADAAWDYLLQQQCSDGYLRQDFPKPVKLGKVAETSCDDDASEASVDATALAVVLLHDVAETDEEIAAIEGAVAWLVEQQGEDGSYAGGGQLPVNGNSTGLAGWALRLVGEDDAAAAAAEWVLAHQVPADCEGMLADQAGAIAYDDTAYAAAGTKGITVKTAYQWRLTTVQAAPALLATPAGADPAQCPSA